LDISEIEMDKKRGHIKQKVENDFRKKIPEKISDKDMK